MNKCLIEILDPQGKVRVPAEAYLCVSSTEGRAIPNCRVYAANIGITDMAVMLWAAEQAIKSSCDEIPGLRLAIDTAHEALDELSKNMFDSSTIIYHPEGKNDDEDTNHDE